MRKAAESMPQKRPFGVTLLLWMVLFFSAWGAIRLAAALSWWDVLAQFGARLSPLYLSITGAGWIVVGAVLLWSIWAGRKWSYLALPAAVLVWLTQYWIERIFFQAPRANLGFTIAASILLMTVTVVAIFNRRTRNFLLKSEAHEQPEQDTTSA